MNNYKMFVDEIQIEIFKYLDLPDKINLHIAVPNVRHLLFGNTSQICNELELVKSNDMIEHNEFANNYDFNNFENCNDFYKFIFLQNIFKYDCYNLLNWMIMKNEFDISKYFELSPKYDSPKIMKFLTDINFFANSCVTIETLCIESLFNIHHNNSKSSEILCKAYGVNKIWENSKYNICTFNIHAFSKFIDKFRDILTDKPDRRFCILPLITCDNFKLLFNITNFDLKSNIVKILTYLAKNKDENLMEFVILQLDSEIVGAIQNTDTRGKILDIVIYNSNLILLKYLLDTWNIDFIDSLTSFFGERWENEESDINNIFKSEKWIEFAMINNYIIPEDCKYEIINNFIPYCDNESLIIRLIEWLQISDNKMCSALLNSTYETKWVDVLSNIFFQKYITEISIDKNLNVKFINGVRRSCILGKNPKNILQLEKIIEYRKQNGLQ